MQRQRYLKLQEEKKLLESNNDRGKMMGMRKPGFGSAFDSREQMMQRNPVKMQNPLARPSFDSDEEM